jgi:hypothetical protein
MSTGTPIGSSSYDFERNSLDVALKFFFPDVKPGSSLNPDEQGALNAALAILYPAPTAANAATIADRAALLESLGILKVGLLGYTTELMADIWQDGVFQRDVLYDEQFLNTAKLPRSIYNYAKISNYDVGFATPSTLRVTFSMSKPDAVKLAVAPTPAEMAQYGLPSNVKFILVDASRTFAVGDYEFMLARDVLIILRFIGLPGQEADPGKYAVTARYNINVSKHESLPAPASPYLRNYTTVDSDGNARILIEMPLLQIVKSTQSFQVFTTDVSETLIYNVVFPDQLAYFDIKYRKPGEAVPTVIPQYFNDLLGPAPNVMEWGYFTFRDTNSLDVYFSSIGSSFRPEFNSELTIDTYTTKGSSAVFKWDGPIYYSFPPGRLSKLDVVIAAIDSAAGGSDILDLKGLKQAVVEHNLTRDSLISQIDINNFFRKIGQANGVNGSEFLFMKKRDDIQRRIITCFALARGSVADGTKTGKQYIVPTNTFDVATTLSALNASGRVIPAGTQFIYDHSDPLNLHFRLLDAANDVVDGEFVYSSPFLMVFRTDPFPRIVYYKNQVSDQLPSPFAYLNYRLNGEFLISSPVSVRRDGASNDAYDIGFALQTNVPDFDIRNNVQIYGQLVKKDPNGNTFSYGYFPFELKEGTDGNYLYTAQLTAVTDPKFIFDLNYRMGIANSLIIPTATGGITSTKTYVPSGLSLEIGIWSDELVDGNESFDTWSNISALSDGAMLAVFKTDEAVDLYTSMADVMLSDIEINGFTGRAVIRSVPGISSDYYSNADNSDELYALLKVFEGMLHENKPSLENNADLDLKFYNTWGPSRTFVNAHDNLPISTNVSVSLRMKTAGTIDAAIGETINDTVIKAVADANSTGRFSFSNVARVLEDTISNVQYTEFVSVNGITTAQTIKAVNNDVSAMTTEQLIRYVPEYLNVAVKRSSYLTQPRKFAPDITINYNL